jgi:hypothetical protein
VFSLQGLTPVQLATCIAEWAPAMGQVSGVVRLADDLVLSDCYEYCQRRARRSSVVSSPTLL